MIEASRKHGPFDIRWDCFASLSTSQEANGWTSRGVHAVEEAERLELPVGLDWGAFSARCFPGRRRHDLEALTAYGAYRRLAGVDAQALRERRAMAEPSRGQARVPPRDLSLRLSGRPTDVTQQPVGSAAPAQRAEQADVAAALQAAVEGWEGEGGAIGRSGSFKTIRDAGFTRSSLHPTRAARSSAT
jgi:hypothetical protein